MDERGAEVKSRERSKRNKKNNLSAFNSGGEKSEFELFVEPNNKAHQ
jgi:uncharacterized protein YxeA